MVGQTSRAIAGALIAVAIASLALATPSAAQIAPLTPPAASTACPDRPTLDEAQPERDTMLTLPDDWAGFADMSMHWLAIRTQLGTVLCVETTWAIDADNFEQFDGRFLGFEWWGYEAGGYMMIDTAATGSVTDIGAKPVFSPDRGYFAAVQFSDAGWGGLEGFAVWRTYAGGMSPVHVDTQLPTMADWRIDKWEEDGCIQLSSIPYERIADWTNLQQYERDRFISRISDGWKLSPGAQCGRS